METTVNHQSMLFAWSSILAEALQKHPDRSGPFLQGLDLVQSFHRKAGSDGNSSSEIFGSSQGKHIEIRSQSNNACCCCGAHHSPGKLVSHFFRTTGWQVSQDTQWMYMEIRIAAEDIWHTTQLTGCSYLVLQSHNTFWVWPRFPAALVFISIAKCFTCDAYLVLGVFLPPFTAKLWCFQQTGVRPNTGLHLTK